MLNNRRCYKCCEIKSIYLFVKDATSSKRFKYICKECTKITREEKKDYFLNYRKNYTYKYNAQKQKEYRERHPEAERAHHLLHYAVKIGKIKKLPCTICRKFPSEAHHPTYSKPLEVIWLCKSHHGELKRNSRLLIDTKKQNIFVLGSTAEGDVNNNTSC